MMKTTAQDVMSTDLITIHEGATIEDTLKVLINNRVTGLPVVDKANTMIGIVSEYDILVQLSKMLEEKDVTLTSPVRFTAGAEAISIDTDVKDIIDLFINLKYRRLPVVDKEKKLVGIITRRDVMKVFYYRARLT